MAKKQISLRVSKEGEKYLEYLIEDMGTTQTEVIMTALRDLYEKRRRANREETRPDIIISRN